MSTQNQISISIPEETIAELMDNFHRSKALLAPYLQGLKPSERQFKLKMGDKTVATVLKTKDYLETNPEFIPFYMNTNEFLKDATVVKQLSPLANLATQLARDIEDTVMLAGCEAAKQALIYYSHVKDASRKGIPSAEPIYDDLKQRFIRKNKKADTDQQ